MATKAAHYLKASINVYSETDGQWQWQLPLECIKNARSAPVDMHR